MSLTYDPWKRVDELEDKYGDFGLSVLDAFNQIDPFHCFYGNDVNPDEYASYANRFCEKYLAGTGYPLEAAVRDSFHESQLHEEWVTTEDIRLIAGIICEAEN